MNTEIGITKLKTKPLPSRPTQKSILAGVVIRKRPADESINGVSKVPSIPEKSIRSEVAETTKIVNSSNGNESENLKLSEYDKGALKCIGILPGMGKYVDSSDSEKSTDTDDDYDFSDYDWVGRKAKKSKEDCHN